MHYLKWEIKIFFQVTPISVSKSSVFYRTPRSGVAMKMLNGTQAASGTQYKDNRAKEPADDGRNSFHSVADVNENRSPLDDVEFVPFNLMMTQPLAKSEQSNIDSSIVNITKGSPSTDEVKSRQSRQVPDITTSSSRFLNYLAIMSGSHTIDTSYLSLEEVTKVISMHQQPQVMIIW